MKFQFPKERLAASGDRHARTCRQSNIHGRQLYQNASHAAIPKAAGPELFHGDLVHGAFSLWTKANIIGAMMLARTPVFVFMAKRGVTNSQAFKEDLQSDYAISLRMLVDEPPN